MANKHNKNIPQSSSFILAKNKELLVSKGRANEQWDLAHLELEDSLYDMEIPDPFDDMTEEDFRHPDRFIMSLMMEPDYFGWTCKHLFGIDLLPMQCAILKEMWYRPFPMLLASRGFGKSFILSLYFILRALLLPGRKIVITGAGFRQSKIVFGYAEAIWMTSPILRDLCGGGKAQGPHHDTDVWYMGIGDSVIKALPLGSGDKIRGQRANDIGGDEFGCLDVSTLVETHLGLKKIGNCHTNDTLFTGNSGELEQPVEFIETPETDAYEVTMKGGYSFICSNIHQSYTHTGWKLAKNLRKGDLLEFENHYIFPAKYLVQDYITVDENLAWIMGLLIAEGSINNKYRMSVEMTDKDAIDKLSQAWFKLDSKLSPKFSVRPAYKDHRNWICKESYVIDIQNSTLRETLKNLGLTLSTSHNKTIPWSILQSPRNIVIAFLRGLFQGDGSAFVYDDKTIKNRFSVAYYSVNKELCQQVQVLLSKLDIYCGLVSRESKISNNRQWMLRINGLNALKFQETIQVEKWNDLYNIAHKSKKYTSFCTVKNGKKYLPVVKVNKIEGKRKLYDFYLPKSHSFIGNGFRQHNSIPRDIFEHVVAGFGVVAQDPVEQVKEQLRISNAKKRGEWTQDQEIDSMNSMMPNQIVLSGTAGYSFNHFAEYWRRYKTLIQSQGDQVKLAKDGINPKISWDSYSVIRIPVELLPKGFMDEDQVERAAATINTDVYSCEYGCCFSVDSNGFFKRSLIEKCSVNPTKPIILPSGEVEIFHAMMQGNPGKKYVYGIDPAATKDSFAICILEVHPDHARIVHMWTTNKGDHETRLANKQKISNNYFAFCVRKIRDLMKIFPCEAIAMDVQGGGRTIAEGFKDKLHIEEGELPIIEFEEGDILWDGKEKSSDGELGLHILELVQFGEAKYTYEANNGLKNDMEHQRILFPFYDSIELVLAGKSDMEANRDFDTLEEVISEIEELKNEITIIQHLSTDTGKERWAAPEIKDPNTNKKGRSHDDRYAAFLMAASAARRMRSAPKPIIYQPTGGFVGQRGPKLTSNDGRMYEGPGWIQEKLKEAGCYGTCVIKNK